MFKRYRYRIYPTKVQEQQLAQHFGAVRYIYNWALATKKQAWEESKENVSRFDLQGRLPAMKKELEWLNDPNANSLQIAIQHLDAAFKGFFMGKGYPRFKTKVNYQSATHTVDSRGTNPIKFEQSTIRIPKIGLTKAVFSQRFEGQLKGLTIIKTPSGKYFASCLVELDLQPTTKSEPVESDAIGVDLGIKHFATLSTGEKIDNPRYLNKSLKRLKRAQRQHTKKKKDGKNRDKSRRRLALLHEKVANQRKDFLHKVTTRLTRENQANSLCIEDLNVKGMVTNHKLARHLNDVAFGTFRTMLEYKADWYGKNVLVIDRFAPSSKQCTCGHKNTELKLSQRSWTCSQCGTTHDRDLLAPQNIVRFAFHPETAKTRT